MSLHEILVEMLVDFQTDGAGQENGNGVSYLLELGDFISKETIAVGERLNTGGFTYGKRAGLIGMEYRAPMGVAFSEHRASEGVPREPSVTFRMIAAPGLLHAGGEEIMRNVRPRAALGDVA